MTDNIEPKSPSGLSKTTKRVAVVLLVWQRLQLLKLTLKSLTDQTNKNFTVILSNGNLDNAERVEKTANFYRKLGLSIEVYHDGNDLFAFRRLLVGKKLAEQGYEIVLFIDDDITFAENYVADCISQYEPKTYKSGFAWTFQRNGENYYRYRTKVSNNNQKINYCGTGTSMIDASIFLEEGLIKDAPEGAIKIEDLWLSYYANHILKWDLLYMEVKRVRVGGSDHVALYKELLESQYNKAHFLKDLVSMGWKLD
jgi:glycosyltransferase involved in cell wall biosynthesis